MKNILTRNLLIAACCLVFPAGMSAQFSGSGSGTKEDPYRIFNADQLNQVRNFLGTSYVYFSLEADIDMTGWIAENNPSQGWLPIGDINSSFSGKFNGNGHTISNLWINRPNTNYIGLFGSLEDPAEIQNIKLENAEYIGYMYIGGIAGYLDDNSIISDCVFKGILTGNSEIGGICGDNFNSEISSCYSYSIITGVSALGGICGYNYYTDITNSYSNGRIKGNEAVGGIVGRCDKSIGYIHNCYSNNFVIIGNEYVGGIIGKANTNAPRTTNCVSINEMISSKGDLCRTSNTLSNTNNLAWTLTQMFLHWRKAANS